MNSSKSLPFAIRLLALTVALAGCASELSRNEVSTTRDFDDLWDYDDPARTESTFRTLLSSDKATSADLEYRLELLTQVARAQGLQLKFEDALETLNQVDTSSTEQMKTVRVRSLLERGRVLNSSGKSQESVPFFKEALSLVQQENLEFYKVDAVHMLGIVTKGEDSLRWNEEAIRLTEASQDPRTQRWLGPLYNNTGWTYFDMQKYESALRMFERDIAYRQQRSNKTEAAIARWSAAKVMRHLGRVEEALNIQMELLRLPELQGGTDEGYTREEIAECLVLLHRPDEAAPYFGQAWELLHDDPWLQRDEPARLERLKKLGKSTSTRN